MKLLIILIFVLTFVFQTQPLLAEPKATAPSKSKVKSSANKKKLAKNTSAKAKLRAPAQAKTKSTLPVKNTIIKSESQVPVIASINNALPEIGNKNDVRVIEVRKRLALSNSEKNYKEFFINGGSSQGLREGSWVTIERRVPVHDPFLNSSIGDMYVLVGELELIKVTTDLSVARLLEIKNPYFRPILEFDAIMIGDRLDLSSLRAPASKKKERFVIQAVDSEYQDLKQAQDTSASNIGMDTDLNAAVIEEVVNTQEVVKITTDNKVVSKVETKAEPQPTAKKAYIAPSTTQLSTNKITKKEILSIPQ